jgi:hypothetical protein
MRTLTAPGCGWCGTGPADDVPPLTRRFLATAAVCLLAGISLGLVMVLQREFGGHWAGPLVVSAHTHLILVGAVLEAIFGTALWLFPRPVRGQWQAPAWVGELAWGTLTSGTVLRAIAEILRGDSGSAVARWAIAAGAGLQVIGIAAGLLVLQPRVRASVARPESA